MKFIKIIVVFLFFTSTSFAQVSFQSPDTIKVSGSMYSYCIVKDFNHDSYNDLIIITQFDFTPAYDYKIIMYRQGNNHFVYYGTISYPNFYPGVQSVSSGDLNNDGLTDLVIGCGNYVMIYFQNANGFFNGNQVLKIYSGDWVYGLACGDLNNDGLCDIAASHWREDSLKVFYQQFNGIFTKHSYYKKISIQNEMKIRDMNNDGLNDVILSNGRQVSQWVTEGNKFSFAIYLQDANTHLLHNHLLYKLEDGIYNSLDGYDIADLNNDGYLDVATTHMDQLFVWYQDSTNNLMFQNYPTHINTYYCAGPVRIADYDNDGKNEIIVAHGGWGVISIFEPNQNYLFSTYRLCLAWLLSNVCQDQMDIGDINNDGRIDMAIACSGGVCIMRNNSGTNVPELYNDKDILTIYPNPAKDNITIETPLSISESNLTIFNLQGQILLQQPLEQNNTQIDITQLPDGVYFAKIQLKDGSIAQKKFVVAK